MELKCELTKWWGNYQHVLGAKVKYTKFKVTKLIHILPTLVAIWAFVA
jgi:hypothetical protein